ncbi:MAG: hypothetical protein DRP96_00550 [Candidatus Neomarinimicrobiota bacterium]|nr:MAG: hypothetical protein DRP96_00550 [Candidatus Neomarinimicrobiota bacterium]
MRFKYLFFITAGLLVFLSGCSVSISREVDILPVEQDIITQPEPRFTYDNYWDAVQHFDFDYINRNKVNEEQRNFVRALKLSMEGKYEDAEKLLSNLFQQSSDSLMRENIAQVLSELMTYNNEWERLVDLDRRLPQGLDSLNTIAFARVFQSLPPENYNYPKDAIILPTKLSISGTPVIEVMVNGKKQKFWIDTGAEMTVLASDIAKECNVREFKDDIIKVGTSTDIMIDTWPGVINELKIGGLTIENHPTIIIDKKDLEFKIFKLIRILKIDGILGWNAIMNMHLEIDYKNGQTTIRKPKPSFNPDRNFHFISVPFLSLTDTLGTPFHFFLDTGSNATGLFKSSLTKLDTSNATNKTAIVGGAGGARKIRQTELYQQAFILGSHRLNFDKIHAHGEGKVYLMYFDGIIGSDVARNGTLVLDFRNGLCELKKDGDL